MIRFRRRLTTDDHDTDEMLAVIAMHDLARRLDHAWILTLAAALALAGCLPYLKQLPVTDAVARASTYRIAVQARSGLVVSADAFAIDEHHLVTAGSLCAEAENIALLVDRAIVPVLAHVGGKLCLLDAPPSVKLGPPMVLARTWHPHARYLNAIGSPEWSPLGVVGVVLELDLGKVTSSAGLADLAAFARAQHADVTIAPPLSDVDMDVSCQQGAKTIGWCSTFEPALVHEPGDVDTR